MNVQSTNVSTSGPSCLSAGSIAMANSASHESAPQRVEPNTPLSSRAREILDSLKEQRESLLGRWNGSGNSDEKNTTLPLDLSCVSPDRSMAIQKLQASLQRERQGRLRLSKQGFLPITPQSATCSVDGSDTGKRSVGTRSATTTTEETESSTAYSPVSQHSDSSLPRVTIDAALFFNKSIHIPNVGGATSPVQECLGDIIARNEASSFAVGTDRTHSATEKVEPTTKPKAHPTSRLYGLPSIPLSPGSLSCDEEDPELVSNDPPSLSMRCNKSERGDNVSPLAASVIPVSPSKPRNFDASSRPSSNRSATLLSLNDVDIPLELSPIDKRSRREASSSNNSNLSRGNNSPETCSAQSDCSTLTAATSMSLPLQTKKERAAYIGQLYPASYVASGTKMRSPTIRPSTGLRRHERNHINQVMVRGRVAILKPSNQRVFVTTAEAEKRAAFSGRSARRRRHFVRAVSQDQGSSFSEDEQSVPRSTGALEGSDLSNDTFTKQELDEAPNADQTHSTTNEHQQSNTSGDDSEDESLDDNRKERLAFIRQLEEDVAKASTGQKREKMSTSPTGGSLSPNGGSVSASSDTSTSSDFIQISDDSSCELTTTSEVSEWVNSVSESTFLLGHESIADTVSVMSGVTMPPLSPLASPVFHRNKDITTKRRFVVAWKEPLLSEIQASSMDEESIHECAITKSKDEPLSKPNLFVAGRAADSLCFANGGHFSIATKSGMVLSHTSALKLIRLDVKPLPPKSVRLSTDLRCGTKGSLYDIAIRTGCNIREPYIFKRPKRRPSVSKVTPEGTASSSVAPKNDISDAQSIESVEKGYLKARGGIYDTLLHSGLTRDTLRRRAPLSVTTNQPALRVQSHGSDDIVPEHISDRQCGAASSILTLLRGS